MSETKITKKRDTPPTDHGTEDRASRTLLTHTLTRKWITTLGTGGHVRHVPMTAGRGDPLAISESWEPGSIGCLLVDYLVDGNFLISVRRCLSWFSSLQKQAPGGEGAGGREREEGGGLVYLSPLWPHRHPRLHHGLGPLLLY